MPEHIVIEHLVNLENRQTMICIIFRNEKESEEFSPSNRRKISPICNNCIHNIYAKNRKYY